MASGFRGVIWAGSLLLVGLIGCGKSSPTEPVAQLRIEDANYPNDTGMMANVSGEATILEVESYFDGNLSQSRGPAPARSSTKVGIGAALGVAHGHHTLRIQIKAQTSSPNTYRVSGIVAELYTGGGFNGAIQVISLTPLPDQTKSLATGDAIVYDFDF